MQPEQKNLASFTVNPNPATTYALVTALEKGDKTIWVQNALGACVFADKIINSENDNLNLQPFNPGIYIIKVFSKDGDVQVQKLIKIR